MLKLVRLGIILFYLAALLLASVLMLKPGTAIFYLKLQAAPEKINQVGDVFEYPLSIDSRIFDIDTVLFFEDRRAFEPATAGYLESAGSENYTVIKNHDTLVTIRFAPNAASAGSVGDHAYQIYIRPFLFSSQWGGRIFLILILGLAVFGASVWRTPEKRALLKGPPVQLFKNWVRLFDRSREPGQDGVSSQLPRTALLRWSAMNIIWIAFGYILLEWLFFVTKPSFLDNLLVIEKIKLPVITGLMVALLSLSILGLIWLLDSLLRRWFPAVRRNIYHLPGALLAASLALVLIDNFTYTVFSFGIVNSELFMRVVYALVFTGLLVYFLNKFRRSVEQAPRQRQKQAPGFYPAAALVAASVLITIASIHLRTDETLVGEKIAGKDNLPNIILLGADGVNAASMSAYGYERDTTPFISDLAKTSLVGENNFSNGAHSMGSDTALLTSRLPFDTRVLYPPDTLKGEDRYLHLPGILRLAGYRTVSLGVPYYVDADTINFQNAFDAVNCVEKRPSLIQRSFSELGFDDVRYFFMEVTGRITERLAHIFFVQDMVNPLTRITDSTEYYFADRERMECLRNDLYAAGQTGQPLFAHVHLMSTHGPMFYPETRFFSAGQEETDIWLTDFYDDAILNFDREVSQLVAYLQELGLYENTVLVLYTDHGQQYDTLTRLPLIMHFPKDQYARSVAANTQNMDIAPTLLDYLDINQPEWMRGSSLLGELDPTRLIFAGYGKNIEATSSGLHVMAADAYQPPFYQFGGVTIVQCQRAYTLNLVETILQAGEVEGHTAPCGTADLHAPDGIKNGVGAMLVSFGYRLPEDW